MKFTALDKLVALSLCGKGWAAISALINIFLISRYLTPYEQGYYYTFYSLIALQVFFELGLNYAVIQFTSHEAASLRWRNNFIGGSLESKSNLIAIFKYATKWYLASSIALSIVLIPAGIIFFRESYSEFGGQLLIAWIGLVLTTSAILIANSFISILEGCHKQKEVIVLRLIQSMAISIATWVALVLNFGVSAMLIGVVVSSAITYIYLLVKFKRFLRQLLRSKIRKNITLHMGDIWNYHWKIAVSWVSGYLIFQVLTPIIFKYEGAETAGKVGMSLQIMNSLGAVAYVWISTKAPKFGMLIKDGKISRLNHLFIKTLKSSLFVLIIIDVAFLIAYYLALYLNIKLTNRILDLNLILVLLFAGIVNHIVACLAVYMRSFKREPLFLVSMATGVIMVTLFIWFIPIFGVSAGIISILIGAIFSLLAAIRIYSKNYKYII